MASSPERYAGPANEIYAYLGEFLVVCPKCARPAVVTEYQWDGSQQRKLVCPGCHYVQPVNSLVRYQAVVKRHCDTCGKAFEKTIPNNRAPVHKLSLPCPHCGTTRTYAPRNDKYQITYPNQGPGDPVFNLPLWLQVNVRGHVLWAYNRAHLQDIRQYVAAKLRERQTTWFTTMVERLPNFIKDAKNRPALLKAIDRLLAN